MSTTFDPYTEWLGIRDPSRPPNHYRLLGLEPFEEDRNVIANAADRQMAYLRTFQLGEHAQQSQRILAEIAAAKVCLLNEKRKSDYDELLRASGNGEPASAKPAETAETSPETGGIAIATAARTPTAAARVASGRSRKKNQNQMLIVGGVVAVLLLFAIGALAIIAGGDQGEKQVTQKPGSSGDNSSQSKADKPDANRGLTSDGQKGSAKDEQAGKEETADPPALTDPPARESDPGQQEVELIDLFNDDPGAGQATAEPLAESAGSGKQNSGGEEQAATSDNASAAGDRAGSAKVAEPDAAAKQSALAEVREQLADVYAVADNPAGAGQLAVTLLARAGDADEPADKFIMLFEAQRMAIQAGHIEKFLEAVDQMHAAFDIDKVRYQGAGIFRIEEKLQSDDQRRRFYELTQPAVDEFAEVHRYQEALALIDLLEEIAQEVRDTEQRREMGRRRLEVKKQAQAYAEYQAAKQTLAANPDDSDANLTVGSYLAFREGDWDQALEHFKKTDLEELRTAATLDTLNPSTPPEQKSLGDLWWDLAGDRRLGEESESALKGRAVEWYERALPGLSGWVYSVHSQPGSPGVQPSGDQVAQAQDHIGSVMSTVGASCPGPKGRSRSSSMRMARVTSMATERRV